MHRVQRAISATAVALVYCVSGSGLKVFAQTISGTVEAEVVRAQDELIRAYIKRDIAAMDGILADNVSFIDDDGIMLDKRQVIDFFRSGDDIITSYKREEDKIRLFGSVAVMTYKARIHETYKSHEVGGTFRMTRVYAKQDGRWRLIAAQDTSIGPERSEED
jgi:ketosteroid isomerase-like protein